MTPDSQNKKFSTTLMIENDEAEHISLAPSGLLVERSSTMDIFDCLLLAHQKAPKKSRVLLLRASAGLGVTSCLTEMASRASDQGSRVFVMAGYSLERHTVWGGAASLLVQVMNPGIALRPNISDVISPYILAREVDLILGIEEVRWKPTLSLYVRCDCT
jgi:hypothetical protein